MKIVVIGGTGLIGSKVVQENLIKESGIPFSIVRATQFFEFGGAIADSATDGTTVRLPGAGVQPIAAQDAAAAVARTAAAKPLNGTVEIAGPEMFTKDEWIRTALTFRQDPREVVAAPEARYFGARPDERLAENRLAEWLPANPTVKVTRR